MTEPVEAQDGDPPLRSHWPWLCFIFGHRWRMNSTPNIARAFCERCHAQFTWPEPIRKKR